MCIRDRSHTKWYRKVTRHFSSFIQVSNPSNHHVMYNYYEVQHKIIQQQGSDRWEWMGDPTGQYSAHNAYNMLTEESAGGSREDYFDKLWSIKVPSKITVFAWRLINDRLPTRKNLQRRQVQLTEILCPFCRINEEDSAHLFLHCNKIQPIWWKTTSWLNLKGVVPLTPKQNFLQHIDVQTDGVRMKR